MVNRVRNIRRNASEKARIYQPWEGTTKVVRDSHKLRPPKINPMYAPYS